VEKSRATTCTHNKKPPRQMCATEDVALDDGCLYTAERTTSARFITCICLIFSRRVYVIHVMCLYTRISNDVVDEHTHTRPYNIDDLANKQPITSYWKHTCVRLLRLRVRARSRSRTIIFREYSRVLYFSRAGSRRTAARRVVRINGLGRSESGFEWDSIRRRLPV